MTFPKMGSVSSKKTEGALFIKLKQDDSYLFNNAMQNHAYKLYSMDTKESIEA